MKYVWMICGICWSVVAYSEPATLAVEGLTTDHRDIRLELSMVYANLTSSQITTVPTQIPIGNGSFVSVPGLVSESTGNSDTLIGTTSIRYGLLPNTEIYARYSGFTKQVRLQNDDIGTSSVFNDQGVLEGWLGLTQTLSPDAATPAFLWFVESAVYERNTRESSAFKSWGTGFSTYRTIDPIVLMLSASYGLYQERDDGGVITNPGEILTISPSFSFAVNDRITLLTGVQWLNKVETEIDGALQGQRVTSSNLELGANLSAGTHTIWGFSLTNVISEEGGAHLKVRFSHYL